MNDTDERLLAAAKQEIAAGRFAERHDAFEALLLRYEKLIWHIARRYFSRQEDAMDASQEAILKIYRFLPEVTLPTDGTLKNWICAVTANTCRDAWRRRHTDEVLATEINPLEEVGMARMAYPSAEETAEARERVGEILQAVSRLPEEHRSLIILRDMTGLSYVELSEATGVPVNTIKSRLSRARASLRKMTGKA